MNEARQLEKGGNVDMVKLTKKKFPKSKGTGKSTKKTGIAKKAEESGMPASVLSAVYRRGIGAAKTTGTRPGVKSLELIKSIIFSHCSEVKASS